MKLLWKCLFFEHLLLVIHDVCCLETDEGDRVATDRHILNFSLRFEHVRNETECLGRIKNRVFRLKFAHLD